MPKIDVVVAGASAGGVEAYQELIRRLPADLPAALFLVLHISDGTPSALAKILRRVAIIPVSEASDAKQICPGQVYVAAADHHLVLESDVMRVVQGPKENRHRPSIDVLFRSAARVFGPRAVGIVLTGLLDDGAAGLNLIKRAGGIAIVQSPEEAMFPSMPSSAMEYTKPDYVLPVAGIAELLPNLVGRDIQIQMAPAQKREEKREGVAVMAGRNSRTKGANSLAGDTTRVGRILDEEMPGNPSPFTCPECSGVLWEMRDGEIIRFRCRVGHGYSPDNLIADNAESLERALWAALRALDESAAVARRMVQHCTERNHTKAAARYEEKARTKERHAEVLRGILLKKKEEPTPVQQESA